MENYFGNDPQYIRSKDVTKEEKNLAVLMHLSVLAGILIPFIGLLIPVVIWALKRNDSPYIDDQGKEVINLIINVFIMGVLVSILCIIVIGFIFLVPLALFVIIAPIVAAVRCSEGLYYKYPFIFSFIK
ncbi:MAG: DUF4870 domain-containing protein [bacterium]